MLIIAVYLLVLWMLGVVGVYSIGWFVHILFIAAIILFLIRIIQGREPMYWE